MNGVMYLLKKMGKQSIKFSNPITIKTTASIAGPKEGQGPLSKYFDVVLDDILNGETSWEKAESRLIKDSMELAIKKSGMKKEEIDYILSGDLLNQATATTFGIRELNIPFFGIFGACSTFGEGMSLASILIDGDFAQNVLFGASSHFCAAEKQFRFPLNLGTQRPLTTTWTVTGSASCVLCKDGIGPFITHITTGKIVDMGITDPNNMGAAMAASAFDTISTHLEDTKREVNYYDLIITGDLGYVGSEVVKRLMTDKGFEFGSNYRDCGIQIFDQKTQDTHSGGSGCACSALTFSGYYFNKLKSKEINKILFVPTGALMSQTSAMQGESIPGIAHAIAIENVLA
jgi:stage V sporulation protein AD